MVLARSEVFISAENQPWSPLEFGVEWSSTPSTVNSGQVMCCLNHKRKSSQILVQRRNKFRKSCRVQHCSLEHRSPLQIDIISNLAPTCHKGSITQQPQVKLQPLHIPPATSNALYNILPPPIPVNLNHDYIVLLLQHPTTQNIQFEQYAAFVYLCQAVDETHDDKQLQQCN